MDFYKIISTWWSGNCYHLEQLKAIISSTDVKAYAYILHDKCPNDNGDGLKKPHYHFLVQLHKNQRGSWFKQFATEDMGIVFIEPTRSPEHAFNYLIHDTEKCRKEKAYLYDPSERISTIDDFTGDTKENEHDELCNDLFDRLDNKITWQELIRRKPKRIHMISNISKAYDLITNERNGRHYDPPPRAFAPHPEMRVLTPTEAEGLPW